MMKVTDLMIGDWINLNFDIDYKTGESIYAPVQVTGINKDGTVDVNCIYDKSESMQDGWDLKLIASIPLTPEILEKNGFKEDFETSGIYWRPDCRKFCIVKELDTWYFAFRVLGETVKKSSGYICISECNYVHKLQHILKDLEVEKEIVL